MDFLAQIIKKKITSIFSTPSLFVMMNNLNLFAETNIRQIISGGDFFPSNALIEIIEKYKDHPETDIKGTVLPMRSNVKFNAYLKEVADLCGIEKNLTTHLARHTFATTVTLNNDVPIESVSKMMGHKNMKTTQIYAKVLDKKVGADMKILQEKLNEKSKGNK